MAESDELNSLLMKVKEKSEKVGLKLNIQKNKIMSSGPITSWQVDGETVEKVTDFIWRAPKSLQMVTQPWNSKTLAPWKKSYDQPKQHIKKQRHYFANKGLSSQSYGFSSRHVWMWELDYKENWEPKNWCFWTVILEKTLESPLDCKEVKPVNPKGNQPWIFIGRTDAEAETPILWPPGVKNRLTGRPWCWERLKAGGEGDDRGRDSWMASPTQWTWVWVNSRSWWWTGRPGCNSWGSKESDTTEQLNWTELKGLYFIASDFLENQINRG